MTDPRNLQPSAAEVAEVCASAEAQMSASNLTFAPLERAYGSMLDEKDREIKMLRLAVKGLTQSYNYTLRLNVSLREDVSRQGNTSWVLLVLLVAAVFVIAGMVGMKG